MTYSIEYHVTSFGGDTYFVPKNSEHRCASKAILSGKFYEPDTHRIIGEILEKRPGNLIHAGTYFGDMVPSFSKMVGDHGMLYAFEPVLESYILAKLTVEKNGLENVFLQNSALSDDFSILKIETECPSGVSHGGGAIITPRGNETITTMPIDSLDIENLSCIHLDVEEHELPALQGAFETIKREKPTILVEDYNQNCNYFLENMGYELTQTTPFIRVWSPKE
jgi:FkbM family methyltransferase